MPKNLPQSKQRTRQIQAHNRKALAENRPDDVLPEVSSTRIWEPHEYNAEIARRAKERGEPVNIPGANGSKGPGMPQGFVVTTTAPEMRDLQAEAKDRAKGIKKTKGGKKEFKAGLLGTEKPD